MHRSTSSGQVFGARMVLFTPDMCTSMHLEAGTDTCVTVAWHIGCFPFRDGAPVNEHFGVQFYLCACLHECIHACMSFCGVQKRFYAWPYACVGLLCITRLEYKPSRQCRIRAGETRTSGGVLASGGSAPMPAFITAQSPNICPHACLFIPTCAISHVHARLHACLHTSLHSDI